MSKKICENCGQEFDSEDYKKINEYGIRYGVRILAKESDLMNQDICPDCFFRMIKQTFDSAFEDDGEHYDA